MQDHGVSGPPEAADRAFVAAAVGFALAALLGRAVLEPFDHGYVRYAGLADEMLRFGDFVVPRLGDWIYLHKPPLFVWIVAAVGAGVGLDRAFPQHAPNLIALALSTFWIVRLGTRLFGRRDLAWLAALVHATTFEVFSLTRDRRIDPLFAAFLLGAFDAFHAATREQARRVAQMALCGALVGAATLVKGPLAIGFFLAVALAWCASERTLRPLAGVPGVAGALALLAVVLPWPLALAARLGAGEAWRLLAETPLTTRRGNLLHYAFNLPGQLAPWTLLVPALAHDLWRRRRVLSADPALRFIGIWLVTLLVLLHASSAKHSRYLLPAFAPLALSFVPIFSARSLAHETDTMLCRLRDGTLRVAFLVFRIAAPAAGIAAFVMAFRTPAAAPGLLVAGWLAFTGAQRGLRAQGSGATLRTATTFGLLALVAFAAIDWVRTADLVHRSRLDEARAAIARVPRDARLVAIGLGERERIVLALLAGRAPLAVNSPGDALASATARGGTPAKWVVIARPNDENAIRAGQGVHVRERTVLPIDREELLLLALDPVGSPG